MGYLSIVNLYKQQDILLFKRCYALEKVHGTSAHVSFNSQENPQMRFFSGGESHTRFVELFNYNELLDGFLSLGVQDIIVYGEAYGGKQQGMKDTYGAELRFIVFDVKINGLWLNVPEMAKIATEALNLEVVPWEEISTELSELDRVRDIPSEVAVRRGMGLDKKREGVVLRPLVELTKNNGDRIIVKHKRDDFSERATPQKIVDPSKLEVLANAEAIAAEWTTPMRLQHVLQRLPADIDITQTGAVIKAMVEDVYKEANGEIVESKEASAAIGKKAAKLFKDFLNQRVSAHAVQEA